MKVFIILAAALLAVDAIPVHEHWSLFKATHGKSYADVKEEKLRFQVFQDNLEKINAHNTRYEAGLETYTMAVNKFADLTSQEFRAMLKSKNGPVPKKHLELHVQNLNIAVPESIDWREKNAVLEVRDQGNCGSCWAFSATGALEGQNALKYNKRVVLSAQQLIDCDTTTSWGCSEGYKNDAMEYAIKHGLNSEEDYPYEAIDDKCRAKNKSEISVKKVMYVNATESALKEALGTIGPISVMIYGEPIRFYSSGIFQSTTCYNETSYLDHAVLAVGYGTENGKKFWIVKNSWGAHWGDEGFFRLARDANNQCGIALDSTYPVLA